MSTASFASLHAGLLARKGEARPVSDPTSFVGSAPAPIFQQPGLRPVSAPPAKPRLEIPAASRFETPDDDDMRDQFADDGEAPDGDDMKGYVDEIKARVREVNSSWPSTKPAVAPAASAARPARQAPPPQSYAEPEDEWRPALAPHSASRHPVRSSVRMTQAQARALRLASLVLDRPQQELLEAGLEAQLQALACSDLQNCACFQAVLAMIDERR